jgi:hypothetical protein
VCRQDYKIFDHLGSVRAVLKKKISEKDFEDNFVLFNYELLGKRKAIQPSCCWQTHQGTNYKVDEPLKIYEL